MIILHMIVPVRSRLSAPFFGVPQGRLLQRDSKLDADVSGVLTTPCLLFGTSPTGRALEYADNTWTMLWFPGPKIQRSRS